MEFKAYASAYGTTIIGEIDEEGNLHNPLSFTLGPRGFVMIPFNPFIKEGGIPDSVEPINVKEHKLLELRKCDLEIINGIKNEYMKQVRGIEIVPANTKIIIP